MGSHPINLAARFLLELMVLISTGMWGLRQTDSWLKFAMAIGIPLVLAMTWGVFAVPDDPSRSGAAPIAVPGILRLIIELGIFSIGVWAISDLDYPIVSLVLGIAVLVHYAVSYDRIAWLFEH